FQPACALFELPRDVPVPAQAGDGCSKGRRVGGAEPLQRLANVWIIATDRLHRLAASSRQIFCNSLDESGEILRVTLHHEIRASQRELLLGVIADRLEHAKPAVARAANEALLDQRIESVQVGVADTLGSCGRKASNEYGEP